jgi:hypothetical protein
MTKLFCIIMLAFSFSNAHAVGVVLSSGTSTLPNSSYHLLTFDMQLGFPVSDDTNLLLQLGMTPPFTSQGHTSWVPYFSFSGQFFTKSNPRFFLSAGGGAFADYVDGKYNPIASLVLNGGVRLGGENFGFQLTMSTYIGITGISDAFGSNSLAWPYYVFLGGFYFGG